MINRILVCFPIDDAPGLRAEAAQLALGLVACEYEVYALGPLGAWRHVLHRAQVNTSECDYQDTRRLTYLVQEIEPNVIHAFGVDTASVVLPLTRLVRAGGAVTLGHGDVTRINPTDFRTASAVFVSCETMREQVMRRLPSHTVISTGYLLPPAEELTDPTQLSELAGELGIQKNAPVVLHADRFTGDEAETARCLIEAVPLVAEHIPGVQVVIAGDGKRLAELHQHAAEVNGRLGRRAVLLPGYRGDIAQVLALATIAVGSGRFAMEAAGAGVALITAGAAGVPGTFTEDIVSTAQFTCCGRHGRLGPLTPRALASELVGLFAYSQYRRRFAAHGQAIVLQEGERSVRAAHIATYYQQTAPTGTVMRSPRHITLVLPDDLREMLFTLPAVSGIRAQYPHAHVSLIASPLHRGLLEQLHIAERVLAKPHDLRAWSQFIRAQWRPRADVYLSFDEHTSSSLALFSLASHRVGFVDSGGSLFYSDHIPAKGAPSPARAFTLTHFLGVASGACVTPPVFLKETQEMVNLSLLAAGVEYTDPLILLCPQADESCVWPMDRWIALAQLLLDSGPERVAVLGATEVEWPEGVVKVMPVQDSLVLATLLNRASLVVAADSAPLHLADLLEVPTIGLYGPTNPLAHSLPTSQGARICHGGYPCHPCDPLCSERRCLLSITPAEVARAVADMRQRTLSPAGY